MELFFMTTHKRKSYTALIEQLMFWLEQYQSNGVRKFTDGILELMLHNIHYQFARMNHMIGTAQAVHPGNN